MNRLAPTVRQQTGTSLHQQPAAQIFQLQKAIGNQSIMQLMSSQMQTTPKRKTVSEVNSKPELAVQTKENATGLPDHIKMGVESLSGMDLSDIKVHYNSPKPTSVSALAYAQGTDIHVAPGQEKHLPHEAWHVVQQRQGRVKPTIQTKAMAVNDLSSLEKEADEMGNKAAQMKVDPTAGFLRRNLKVQFQPSTVEEKSSVMQQVNDYYPSGDKEPHIHIHDGGITFTAVGHSHKTLQHGDQVRHSAIMEVYQELQALNTDRGNQIIGWIQQHFGVNPPAPKEEKEKEVDENLPEDWIEKETADHNPEGIPPVGFSFGSYRSRIR